MAFPENQDAAVELVVADVETAFGDAFPGGGFEIAESLGPVGDGSGTVVVPWVWTGTHLGPFQDIQPTGFAVRIVGTTFLRADDRGEPLHHRIVDWLTLYRQLGMSMVCRRPQTRDTRTADIGDRLPGTYDDLEAPVP